MVVLCERNATLGTHRLGKHTPRTIARSVIRMASPNLKKLAMAIAGLNMVKIVHLPPLKMKQNLPNEK